MLKIDKEKEKEARGHLIHSLERNPNLQKVLITIALPRPC